MVMRSLTITAAALLAATTLQAPAVAATPVYVPILNTYYFMTTFTGGTPDTTIFTLPIGTSFSLQFGATGAGFSGVSASFVSGTGSSSTTQPITLTSNTPTVFSGIFNTTSSATVNSLLLSAATGSGLLTGTLTITPLATVPEAATWAMMTLGFGALGYSLRRRRATYNLA